jgi:hypothetical protein
MEVLIVIAGPSEQQVHAKDWGGQPWHKAVWAKPRLFQKTKPAWH